MGAQAASWRATSLRGNSRLLLDEERVGVTDVPLNPVSATDWPYGLGLLICAKQEKSPGAAVTPFSLVSAATAKDSGLSDSRLSVA